MLRACSSPSQNVPISDKPVVRVRGGDFFRYTDAEKILPLTRLPGQVMFGWLQSIRRWAGNLFDSVPIPSRPSPWLRTSQPNMFCPGRQGEVQSVRQPSLVHNRQFTEDFAPVVDLHGPLFRCLKSGQIQCFQQGCITWKHTALSVQLSVSRV